MILATQSVIKSKMRRNIMSKTKKLSSALKAQEIISQPGVYNLNAYRQQRNSKLVKPKPYRKVGKQLILLTEEQIALVEELASKYTCKQIALQLDVSQRAFFDIRKRQPEVQRSYKKGKARQILTVANLLYEKAAAGDVSSIIFYLKTQAGWKPGCGNEDDELLNIID